MLTKNLNYQNEQIGKEGIAQPRTLRALKETK